MKIDSLFTLINDINRIRFSYYDNDKFNTNIIELSDFLNNKGWFNKRFISKRQDFRYKWAIKNQQLTNV